MAAALGLTGSSRSPGGWHRVLGPALVPCVAENICRLQSLVMGRLEPLWRCSRLKAALGEWKWGHTAMGDTAVGSRRPVAPAQAGGKGWGTLHTWESCSGPSQGLWKDVVGFTPRLLSPVLLHHGFLLLVISPAGSQQRAAYVESPMFFQGGEGDGRAKGSPL